MHQHLYNCLLLSLFDDYHTTSTIRNISEFSIYIFLSTGNYNVDHNLHNCKCSLQYVYILLFQWLVLDLILKLQSSLVMKEVRKMKRNIHTIDELHSIHIVVRTQKRRSPSHSYRNAEIEVNVTL